MNELIIAMLTGVTAFSATNIVPLFANSTLEILVSILGVFFLLVGVWCYTAYKLTHQSAICRRRPRFSIAYLLKSYGNNLVPFVLIGLGVFIVLESQALTPLARGVTCLCLIGLVKINGRSQEVAKN